MDKRKETIYGKVPSYWKIETLWSVSEKVTDGSHYSPKPQTVGKYMCSVKDMTYNRFDFSNCKLISKNDYNKLLTQGCKPEKNDIIISKDGANCLNLIFIFDQEEDLVLLSSIAIVRLKYGINSKFIRYFLLSPACQYIMRNNFVSGSAIPRVVLKDFKKVEIILPPLPEQKAIASVLSCLDDKIDLLHRQNKTLEAMAETLFRQWFVEEADEGWEEVKIGNVLETVLGGTPSTKKPEYWNGGIPWINSGEINNFRILKSSKFITKLGLKKSNTKLLPKGTTVLAITGATLGQISLLEIETCANQSVVGIIPNEKIPKEYIFLWIKYKINEIILNETGGAQPHINKNDINNTEIIIPNTSIMKKGIIVLSPIFNKITNNCFQIQKLEILRNNLLPKLISGEVRITL